MAVLRKPEDALLENQLRVTSTHFGVADGLPAHGGPEFLGETLAWRVRLSFALPDWKARVFRIGYVGDRAQVLLCWQLEAWGLSADGEVGTSC